MAEIIDLDLLVSEPVVFKISGKQYKVPTNLNTEVILKLSSTEQKISGAQKSKDLQKALSLQDELVFVLLSQLNEVTEEWVSKLSHTQKIAILTHYRNRVDEINADPN